MVGIITRVVTVTMDLLVLRQLVQPRRILPLELPPIDQQLCATIGIMDGIIFLAQ